MLTAYQGFGAAGVDQPKPAATSKGGRGPVKMESDSGLDGSGSLVLYDPAGFWDYGKR